MTRYAIHAIAIGFGSGVLMRSAFAIGAIEALLFVTIAAGLGTYACVVRYGIARTTILLCSIACICVSVGIFRMDAAAVSRVDAVDAKLGDTVTVRGNVIADPDTRIKNTQLTVEVTEIAGTPVTSNTRIRAFIAPHTDVAYGDSVRLHGEVMLPANFETDTGRTFNYKKYLKRDGVAYITYYPEVVVIDSGNGNALVAWLLTAKRVFLETVYTIIPAPESALLAGLLLGEKQALGDSLEEAFRETGVIHVVVLSGYNVTLVADAIMRSVWFLSPVWAAGAGGIAIIGFALMTGLSATVVRASIMAILVLVARAIGRPYAIINALLLAGIIMIAHNPYVLAFDPAFQLSFLATVGLIFVSPLVAKHIRFIPEGFQLREIASATIATQIFVLPALLYIVGEVSLVSPIANMLVLVAVPAAMLTGFIAGMIGIVSAVIAFPIAYGAYAILAYQLSVVDLLARVPGGAITLPPVPLWSVVFVYVVFGVWLYRKYKTKDRTGNAVRSQA